MPKLFPLAAFVFLISISHVQAQEVFGPPTPPVLVPTTMQWEAFTIYTYAPPSDRSPSPPPPPALSPGAQPMPRMEAPPDLFELYRQQATMQAETQFNQEFKAFQDQANAWQQKSWAERDAKNRAETDAARADTAARNAEAREAMGAAVASVVAFNNSLVTRYNKHAENIDSLSKKTLESSDQSLTQLHKAIRDIQANNPRSGLRTVKIQPVTRADHSHTNEKPNYKFRSPDSPQRERLQNVLEKLVEATPVTESGKTARRIGINAVIEGDEALLRNSPAEAKQYEEIAVAMTDIALGFVPFVGAAKDLYEALSGRSLLTSERLSTAARTLAMAGFLTAGLGTVVFRTAAPIMKLISRMGGNAAEIAQATKIASHGERLAEASIQAKSSAKLGDKWVQQLPDLEEYAKEFDGHIFKGVGEPGDILYQAQRAGQNSPGRWFSPVRPVNPQHAEEMLNIAKQGNFAEQTKTYVIVERVSGYAGKVVDGSGHQFYIPKNVPLDQIVREIP